MYSDMFRPLYMATLRQFEQSIHRIHDSTVQNILDQMNGGIADRVRE